MTRGVKGSGEAWVREQQGKHVCACGCGGAIVITKSHSTNRIPKYVWGHHTRVRPRVPLFQRFWAKVETRGDDECWLWVGSKDGGGYGGLRTVGPRGIEKAHRVSYLLHYGDFDRALDVLHTCDTPACVNPKHLRLGTHQDNMTDAVRKGRNYRKITSEQAVEIVRRHVQGEGLTPLGREFGLTAPTVWAIVNGVTWGHVTGVRKKGADDGR